MKLHTTLRLLRRHKACEPNYTDFVKKLGDGYGDNLTISFLTILELQGFDDTIWALYNAVPRKQKTESRKLLRLLSCDIAKHVLPRYEKQYPGDMRVRDCIEVTRKFALGQATEAERRVARDATCDAAWDAACAARVARVAWAAWAAWAASDAASDAAWDVARVAASAAEDAETERAWQVQRLQEVLQENEGC